MKEWTKGSFAHHSGKYMIHKDRYLWILEFNIGPDILELCRKPSLKACKRSAEEHFSQSKPRWSRWLKLTEFRQLKLTAS